LPQAQKKEDAVKTFALAATLALIVYGPAQAGPSAITPERGAADVAAPAAVAATAPPGGTVLLQQVSSDLAEPEMFAMMVVGLVLIGYRATRDSSETFR
jgi:hypothetical protein